MNIGELQKKADILNQVVSNNYLAASANKFAQALGYSGGNTFYKRMKGQQAQLDKVQEDWEKLQSAFVISEVDVLITPEIFDFKTQLKTKLLPLLERYEGWAETWVCNLIKKAPLSLLPQADGKIIACFQKRNIRRNLAFWMAVAWLYLEIQKVHPYHQSGQQKFIIAVRQLNEHLLQHFPARIDLQQRSEVLSQISQHRKLNWCMYVTMLGELLMEYVQQGYTYLLASSSGLHFGWGRLTWWHLQDEPLQTGAQLWMLYEPDESSRDCIYFFTCFEVRAGGVLCVKRMHSLHFTAMQQHVSCWTFILNKDREQHDYIWRLSSDAMTLYFQPRSSVSNYALPPCLQRIVVDASNSDVTHAWSRILQQWGEERAWQQHCEYVLAYLGYRSCPEFTIEDVLIGRSHVEISLRSHAGLHTQRFAFAQYPGLQLVTPQQEVLVVEQHDSLKRFIFFAELELFLPWGKEEKGVEEVS